MGLASPTRRSPMRVSYTNRRYPMKAREFLKHMSFKDTGMYIKVSTMHTIVVTPILANVVCSIGPLGTPSQNATWPPLDLIKTFSHITHPFNHKSLIKSYIIGIFIPIMLTSLFSYAILLIHQPRRNTITLYHFKTKIWLDKTFKTIYVPLTNYVIK